MNRLSQGLAAQTKKLINAGLQRDTARRVVEHLWHVFFKERAARAFKRKRSGRLRLRVALKTS